jgi:hypothetical protein
MQRGQMLGDRVNPIAQRTNACQVLWSRGIKGTSAIAWFATPILFGVVFTTCYVVWCSTCRLIARVLGIVPNSGNVRRIANGSFFVIMLALIFVPYERTVTIRMPTKDPVQTPIAAPRPDAHTNRAGN